MIRRAMDTPVTSLDTALATLRSRWGSAAIRLGNGDAALGEGRPRSADAQDLPPVSGALALVPAEAPVDAPRPDPLAPLADDLVSTGFPALDAILGRAGLPPEASATIRGDLSSGKTTLALRCAAEAQARGSIVAYLDLARAFDPVEAVARGIDLRWLLVVRPADVPEGFGLAGALLAGRAVDLLIVDLPSRLPDRTDGSLRRLAAHARRSGVRIVVLEPASLDGSARGALAEVTGLRLELERRGWIRLGRDIVGQRTQVTVAKNRYGPPGRRTDLEIHYLTDGDRSQDTHRFAASP
jgi:RecA/RadA recombinase